MTDRPYPNPDPCRNAPPVPSDTHHRRRIYRDGVCKQCWDELPGPDHCPNHPARPIFRDGICHTEWHQIRREGSRMRRASRVASTYGLDRERHEALFRRQGGKSPTGRPVTLKSPIDHDHASGAVRGILDDPTNRFVGYCGDRPQAFLNLWAYLTRPPAQFGLITDHRFKVYRGLFQCLHRDRDADGGASYCGRLENEHG